MRHGLLRMNTGLRQLAILVTGGFVAGFGCQNGPGAPPRGEPSAAVEDGGSPPDTISALGDVDRRDDAPEVEVEVADDDPEPAFAPGTMERLRAVTLDPNEPLPADCSNRWADDDKAAALGQKLFFDRRLSGALLDGDNLGLDQDNDGVIDSLGKRGDTGRVACASCHVPQAGFSDSCTPGKQISLASGWVLRRTMPLLDVAWSPLLMWDGRRDAFYNQIFGVLESHLEANSSRLFVAQQVQALHAEEYASVFGVAPLEHPEHLPTITAQESGCRVTDRDHPVSCCGVPGDRDARTPGDGLGCNKYDGLSTADQQAVTRVVVNVGKAMGAYMRRLSCGPGRFDGWVRGQETFSRQEQRGAALFVEKARCLDCHSGPRLSDYGFHNVGLEPRTVAASFADIDDPGASVGLAALRANADGLSTATETPRWSDCPTGVQRAPSEVPATALGAFKTPSLRCMSRRTSFMHTGQMTSLEEVLAFFNKGGSYRGYLGKNELVALQLSKRELADLLAFLRTLDGPGPPPALMQNPLLPPGTVVASPCAGRLLP